MTKQVWRLAVVVALLLPASPQLLAAPVLKFDAKGEDGTKVGEITIDTFKQYDPGGGVFGVTIAGGFKADPACPLAPGFQYFWIQAYIGQPTLYSWEDKTKWSYDRTRDATDDKKIADGSPFYVNQRPATNGYGDQPSDNRFTDGNKIEFLFQTALVCAKEGTGGAKGVINMIDGFTWGFKWVENADKTHTYTATAPVHSTANFGDLMTAFKNDPDQATLGDKWTLQRGTCCVPEPSTLFLGLQVLCLLAGFAVWRYRASVRRVPVLAVS